MEMTSLSSIITMEIDGGTMRDPASIIENQVEDSVRDAPEHLAGGVAQAAGDQAGGGALDAGSGGLAERPARSGGLASPTSEKWGFGLAPHTQTGLLVSYRYNTGV